MRTIIQATIFAALCLTVGCGADDTMPDAEADDLADSNDESQLGVAEQALSYVTGCHFYVGSNYGGSTIHMKRNTTISDLKSKSMGDKISSIRLLDGATTRMWIDSNYNGNSRYITGNVATLHTSSWGNLGDNASSVDCY